MEEDQQPQDNKKGRGPAKLKFLVGLKPGEKFPIEDTDGVPTGDHAANLSSFVGYIARDGNKLPLTQPTWKKFKKEFIRGLVDEVKDVFDLPPGLDDWVKSKLNERWRDHKAEMKKKGFDPYETTEERIANRPDGVLPSQWGVLVGHWQSSSGQLASERNKRNRSKQTIKHRAGSKSFMRYSAELEVTLGRKPTRVEIYKKTHTRDGNPVEGDEAAEKLKQMEDMQTRASQDDSPEELHVYGPNDIYSQVMGPDRGGRVRCYGSTVKPKKFWRGESSNASAKKNTQEVVEMRQQLGTITERLNWALERIAQLEGRHGGGSNSGSQASEGQQHGRGKEIARGGGNNSGSQDSEETSSEDLE